MINAVNLFDCTIREAGYQTGWFFDKSFLMDYYRFLESANYDYMELGFFHNPEADPGRGCTRYCGVCNDELNEIFRSAKNILKLSAMRDIQRPLAPLVKAENSVIDTVRILTRSKETKIDILAKQVEEVQELGYEVFINFTSAGYNTIEQNMSFAKLARKLGLKVVYFADTESVFTSKYIADTIENCRAEGIEAGIHLHNKNGTAEMLLDVAFAHQCQYTDSTLLGIGGKWHDGNIPTEYLMKHFNHNPGYELTRLKTNFINQLIKYHEHSAAIWAG